MIFILITAIGLTLPTAITWVYFDLLAASAPAVQQAAYALGKAVQFALPGWGWVYRRVEGQSHDSGVAGVLPLEDKSRSQTDYFEGLPGPGRPTIGRPTRGRPAPDYKSSLVWGVLTGLVIAGAALAMFHWVLEPSGLMEGPTLEARAKLKATGLNSLPVFIAVALFYSLCHSGLEEYYWRWFMFRHLALRWNMTTATVVSSLGFMAHHVLVLARYFGWGSPLTYGLALSVAVGGVIWAVLYRRYGTIVGPWVSHALVDAAIFAIAYQMGDWSNAS